VPGDELPPGVVRNADIDWDRWPVEDYLSENYRQLHPSDAAVIDHHSAYLARLAPGSIGRSLEFGAGPNLYPLLLMGACSLRIHAVEPAASSVAYLHRQVQHGMDPSWQPFYHRCRTGNPALPADPSQVLIRVRVIRGDARQVQAGGYDLASMHFVAEAATEDQQEFEEFCRAFTGAVRPGGHLVAAFMENLGRYRLGEGPCWPHHRIDADHVQAAFAPLTDGLRIDRIDADPTLPDYGYTGMILLTARTRSPPGVGDRPLPPHRFPGEGRAGFRGST
jgi:hypothetical protein